MPLTTDKIRISVYLDEDIKKNMEKLAKKRRRSLSNLIESMCDAEIQKSMDSRELGKEQDI